MKEINLPSGNYLFIEVPDDAYNFSVYKYNITSQIRYFYDNYQCDITIQKADWGIISTTKDITEEQANSLVEKPEYGWYLTYTKGNMDSYHCQTAKESLQSLIQANDLDINKNYLILKKA